MNEEIRAILIFLTTQNAGILVENKNIYIVYGFCISEVNITYY